MAQIRATEPYEPKSNQKAVPDSGESVSHVESDSSKSKSRHQPQSLGVEFLIGKGVEQQVAEDWLKVRRAKKAPLTMTAWNLIEHAAEKNGTQAGIIVKICAEKNWASFNSEWEGAAKLVEQAAKVVEAEAIAPDLRESDPILFRIRSKYPKATRGPDGRIALDGEARQFFIGADNIESFLNRRECKLDIH